MTALARDLADAYGHHRAGRLQQAEQGYRKVLQRDANHPDALHLMGVVALQTGRHRLAIDHISRAAELDPGAVQYQQNLGNAYGGDGQYEQAAACFRRALEIHPESAENYDNLGKAYQQLGRLAAAVECFRRALQIRPDFANAHYDLGNALQAQQQYEEAALAFREALRLAPHLAEAHYNFGCMLLAQNKTEQAIQRFQAAIVRKPDYAEAYLNLGNAQLAQGKQQEAICSFEEASRINPQYTDAFYNLAVLNAQLGERRRAIDLALKVIRKDATNLKSMRLLADLKSDIPDHAVVELEHRLRRNDLPHGKHVGAHFALGRIYDQRGQFDDAFKHIRIGNQLMDLAYDPQQDQFYFDGLIESFTQDFFDFQRKRIEGSDSELPVFVVGMPRSGTTLVEQILASHPQVFGAGELGEFTYMTRDLQKLLGSKLAYPRAIRDFEQDTAKVLVERYLSCIQREAEAARRVVDKMPDNFLHLGLIALLFPNCRIIHCRRHPLDVCLSCFFQRFEHVKYTTTLEHLGWYYRQYARLMRHWQAVLPVPIFEVQYEVLVDDPDTEIRRLIHACGLEWDPACRDFHRTGRRVKTASLWQVRQPVYQSSCGRWKNYEQHLGPISDLVETLQE